jgi:hypothetical protein
MIHKHKKCVGCGKMFLEIRKSDLCPECMAKEGDDFQKVKDYLYDYPGSTISDISKFTGVTEALIVKWYEDGRLEESNIKALSRCKICGRPLTVGDICKNCMDEMNKPSKKTDGKKHQMYISSKKE